MSLNWKALIKMKKIQLVLLLIVIATSLLFATTGESSPASAFKSNNEWEISPYPNGHNFAFTIIHDADSAYSQRLAPLFEVFDKLGLKITATLFTFWADWARKGKVWSEWNALGKGEDRFFVPIGVPLEDEKEAEFYKFLALRGHEIGMHTPSDTSDTREELIRAYKYFKKVFGHYPKVYVEHSNRSNKEDQSNEGANPESNYYSTDLLNFYKSWIWVDGPGALPNKKHKKFYDILAVNGSPFSKFALDQYGIAKGFVRTGKWKNSNGDGFLDWYTQKNIDILSKERGLALVYTHLNYKWLDPKTRRMRKSIKNRLKYLVSKDGWFVPASKILDRFYAIDQIELSSNAEWLKIINKGSTAINGLTVMSHEGKKLYRNGKTLKPNKDKEIFIGVIQPSETLSFKIVEAG